MNRYDDKSHKAISIDIDNAGYRTPGMHSMANWHELSLARHVTRARPRELPHAPELQAAG